MQRELYYFSDCTSRSHDVCAGVDLSQVPCSQACGMAEACISGQMNSIVVEDHGLGIRHGWGPGTFPTGNPHMDQYEQDDIFILVNGRTHDSKRLVNLRHGHQQAAVGCAFVDLIGRPSRPSRLMQQPAQARPNVHDDQLSDHLNRDICCMWYG